VADNLISEDLLNPSLSGPLTAKCAGVSERTRDRLMDDPDPDRRFPQPDYEVNGRRFWLLRTVNAWRKRQAELTRERAEQRRAAQRAQAGVARAARARKRGRCAVAKPDQAAAITEVSA
jgi:hypothetical protein